MKKTLKKSEKRIKNAFQAYQYFQPMELLTKEYLKALYLNEQNHLLSEKTLAIGNQASNFIHPTKIFLPAIKLSAKAVILAHNHPSGEAFPSPADLKTTKRLLKAGKLLGIDLLDHLIIAKGGFISIIKELQKR